MYMFDVSLFVSPIEAPMCLLHPTFILQTGKCGVNKAAVKYRMIYPCCKIFGYQATEFVQNAHINIGSNN